VTRWRRKPEIADLGHLTSAGSLSGSAQIHTRGVRGPAPTLEERVDRLAKELLQLDERVTRNVEQLTESINVERAAREDATRAVSADLQRLEAERKRAVRESIIWDVAGTTLFVVGVVLSVAGNVTSC